MRSVVACSCKSSDGDEKLRNCFIDFVAKSSQNSDLSDDNDAARMGVRMHFVISFPITFKIYSINRRNLDSKPSRFRRQGKFWLLSKSVFRLLTKEIGRHKTCIITC